MKQIILALLLLPVFYSSEGQVLTVPVQGGSARASVTEQVGLTEIKIAYSRPAVKGREGQIWGGLIKPGFANGDPEERIPWRAGANETTTIGFSTDVLFEGKPIKSGKYGLFIAYDSVAPVIILSNLTESWGSLFYDSTEDYLRVAVRGVTSDRSIERLTYDFSDQDDSSAVIRLMWEHFCIPFKVSVNLHQLQMQSFENELKTLKGFSPDAWLQFAAYLLEKDTALGRALMYASNAVGAAPSFRAYRIHAEILGKLRRKQEQFESLRSAVYYGNTMQTHFYATGRLNRGDTEIAMHLFRLNHEKAPADFYANYGLATGHLKTGNTGMAKKFAAQASRHATTAQQRSDAAALLNQDL